MSHSHSHSHSPIASSSTSHTHTHDFAEANKHHHNKEGHAHNYSTSNLNDWLSTQCVESILDSWDGWNEDKTEVLDFACGPGLISQKLAPYCKSIVGIDISQAMVDVYNTSVSNNGLESEDMMAVQLDELKDEETELQGRLFDVVFCAQAYHHISDVDAITLALTRRLKPGGILMIIDLDKEAQFGSALLDKAPSEIKEELKKVVAHKGGFSSDELKEILRKSGRLHEIDVEVSHSTTMGEMAALKGNNNWAEKMTSKAEVEIRWLIATGVRQDS